ncbi:ATP-binding protein [Yinghuangia soli]|uniref:ATP-binding protein n=1 Tax=Yinghuangia soli TaxID=2908204 RepID=A0AA41PZG8_9ACTN|nr:ATP-binding protein [Yinghuangia soli]MCF2528663.1 ATP-binding protein [Yinghuangia soli]
MRCPALLQCLELTPEAVPVLRRVLRAHLDIWDAAHLAEASALCLTELLGNVLRHCALDPWITVRSQVHHKALRIEVFDADPRLPEPVTSGHHHLGESGRGLVLVAAYADRFGYAPVVGGKCAWVELDLVT